jgi:hypothetical protein
VNSEQCKGACEWCSRSGEQVEITNGNASRSVGQHARVTCPRGTGERGLYLNYVSKDDS